MTNLSRGIRHSVKSGTLLPALVVDVFYDKASIKLSGNGALYRNLAVVGGPVVAGEVVGVDFTNPIPTVVAQGQSGLALSDVTDLIKKLQTPSSSGAFSWQILSFSNGSFRGSYPADASGLTQALADTSEGIVLLPAVEIAGDFTVQGGATLVGLDREQSIINGAVAANGGCHNLTILLEVSTSNTAVGLSVSPDVKAVSYRDVRVYCSQSGSGNSYAASMAGVFERTFIDCQFFGEALGGGSGYGLQSSTTTLANTYVIGGYLRGTTGPYIAQ